MSHYISPLRYPGGKGKLYNYVVDLISINKMQGCTYVEPFAGGAGLALKLLFNNIVDNIILNDIDFTIYSIWNVILNHTDELCNFISRVALDTYEWQKQRSIYTNQSNFSPLQIGLSAFYLNRTNVSGVLTGGVIGGLTQDGNYKIDARFNRNDLINRVQCIARKRDKIRLYNWNASDFLVSILPDYDNCFIYLDPPYVNKGPRLYRNSFTKDDHKYLSEIITSSNLKWIITYDECVFIKELYQGFRFEPLSVNYSAGQTKHGNEVMIFSNNLIYNNIIKPIVSARNIG